MIDEQILNQALGMKIPGIDQDKIYEFLLQSKYSQNIQNSIEQIQTQKRNQNYFISEITKQYTKLEGKLKTTDANSENSQFFVESIPVNELNSTQKAFYQVYDPTKKILSDRDAQIHNQAQNQENLQAVQQLPQQPYIAKRGLPTAAQQKLEKQKLAPRNNFLQQDQLLKSKDIQQPGSEKIFGGGGGQRMEMEDENNKKYCICDKQPENSQIMVNCENKKCPVEWYHSVCVNLGNVPEEQLEKLEFICNLCKDTYYKEDRLLVE